MRYDSILDFWFADASSSGEALMRRERVWFRAGPEMDAEIVSRFGALLEEAPGKWKSLWRDEPRGRLALILLFDQFPRNVYRGTAAAFRFDAHALDLCESGIDAGLDAALSRVERSFFYMPLQHAETRAAQQRSVDLFETLAASAPRAERRFFEVSLEFARQHRDLIARFGRFPHRNRVLGRATTADEAAYLDGGGATFGQKA